MRPRPQSIHVIINPAPVKRVPLLSILNSNFRGAGIRWDVSITHELGDARRMAREAVEAGADMVASFGGDGTVAEVASALVGTEIPLLILPGGTGNLVAVELDLRRDLVTIERDVERACQRITGTHYGTRAVDVGQIGNDYFLLRVGCGFETGVVLNATRTLKDQFGKWAYVFSALKHLQEQPTAEYEIKLDGKAVDCGRGIACVVANAGIVGVGKLTLAPSVDIDDGKLDVFFIKKANLESIWSVATKMMGIERGEPDDPGAELDASRMVSHWQATSVFINTDPVLDFQVDGDVITRTPQEIRVLPSALQVVV